MLVIAPERPMKSMNYLHACAYALARARVSGLGRTLGGVALTGSKGGHYDVESAD